MPITGGYSKKQNSRTKLRVVVEPEQLKRWRTAARFYGASLSALVRIVVEKEICRIESDMQQLGITTVNGKFVKISNH
jgi:hypothetical protein